MIFVKKNSARHRAESASHAVRNTSIAAAAAGVAVAGIVAPAQASSDLIDLGGTTSYGTQSESSWDSAAGNSYSWTSEATASVQTPAVSADSGVAQASSNTQQDSGVSTQSNSSASGMAGTAYQGLGGAYVLGGTDFKSWDCSGFTQWVYAQNGIDLPRVSWAQIAAGTPTSNPQPGDLVSQNGGGHVGIYIGNGQMISALNPSQGTAVHSVNAMQLDGYYTFR
ncbi:C40 family peptidase [Kocuria sp. cx-455]|uniref:C40 family peptidase n=1 Tax=Kocuria sp. cx-455 TaxID=2771377 RepID=UPI0016855F52|nr:C40 family peptidase [Kocuria sp. cx-455]MBD2765117.1 C40 family peptidase [Kocuria sp. cx-455]